MSSFKKKLLLGLFSATAIAMTSQSASAANWLMLQGTERPGQAPRAKLWGFIQAQYQKDNSDPNPAGGYIPPKLLGPNLTTQEGFNINRARIGVRGGGFPLDNKVNYFFLAEFGNNAITAPGNSFAKITDASVTLNHIPGARIRVGLFKTPGSEEVYQGIAIFDYINFTDFANQQLIERIPNSTYTANVPPQSLPVGTSLYAFNNSVAAARDTGIQIFDTFKVGKWEHSYSVMVGNGNGLNMSDNDDNKDTYLYWSSELVFGGKGPRREGLKVFAWSQKGKRLLDNTNDATHNPQEYDRKRYGAGVTYLQKPFRVRAEYLKADGMIFVGPHAPTFDMNPAAAPGNGENGEADAYYVDFGWYIPNSDWELDARYDHYTRLKGDAFETEWKTTTLGVQYHFNKKTRLTLNHALRSVEAVNFGTGAGPNANLDGIGDRTSIQLTHIF
jgi:hypothetical protein